MTDLDNLLRPPWSKLPLVHDETNLFPQATMDALNATIAGEVASGIAASGVAPASVLPSLTAVTVWGESTSAADWPQTLLASYTGLTVNNRGVSGQGAADVLLRMGVFNPRVTLTGGAIPASGAVTLTAIDPSTGWRRVSGSGSFTFAGTLAGIPGTLTNTFNGTTNTFTFTRTAAGAVVPVPAGTPFLIDPTIPRRNERAVVWTGRNNVEDLRAVDDLVSRAGDALTAQAKDVLVLGVLNGTHEPIDSPAYNRIVASNARRASTWRDHFLDIRRGFIDRGLSIAGVTGTPEDLAYIAADVPPPSLMADNIHPNADGYKVVAYLVAEKLLALGWTSALTLPAVVPASPNALNLIKWHAAYWAEDPAWTPPASGSPITSARDATGRGRDLKQVGAVPMPNYVASVAALNGKPAFQHTGGQRAFHDYVGEVAAPWSLVVITALTTVANSLLVGVNNSNNGLGLGVETSQAWSLRGTSTQTISGGTATVGGHLAVAVENGASSKVRIDGAATVDGDAGVWGIQVISLGGGATAAAALARGSNAHTAFVGIYQGDVTADPLWPNFKAWVASHYGLTIA